MEQEILNSILKNVDEYEFNRGFDYGKEKCLGFKSYEEFVNFQKEKVKENPEILLFFKIYIANKLCIMDKEYMVSDPASGFCFNSEGKIVITCER